MAGQSVSIWEGMRLDNEYERSQKNVFVVMQWKMKPHVKLADNG